MHTDTAKEAQSTSIDRDAIALVSNRSIMRIGFGIAGIFMPIFFYEQFNSSLVTVFFIYIALYTTDLLTIPQTTRLLQEWGVRNILAAAVLSAAGAYYALAFFDVDILTVVALYAVLIALYRASYWVPYHVNLAESVHDGNRGRELSLYQNLILIGASLTPFFGGLLITGSGFATTFIVSAVIITLSVIPLFFLRPIYERYSWGYLETYGKLFERKHRSLLLASAAHGAQVVTSGVVWPIFIYLLLDERYTAVGLITSATIIALMLLQWIVGKLIDSWSEKKMLTLTTILATTGWISKIFVETGVQVFVADSYHRFGRAVNSLAFDAVLYDQAADNGRFVDEYTTLMCIASNVGRIAMLVLTTFVVVYLDVRFAFALAALATLAMTLLNKGTKVG